jgi:hypothetical protein
VAPYTWRDGSDFHGMHPTLLRVLAAETGLQFEYSAGLYARASRALTDGVADLAVTLATPDQDAQGQRVVLLHTVRHLVISLAGAPLTELSQLRGKLLGIARNAYYGPHINDDESIRKLTITDPNQGVRMLAIYSNMPGILLAGFLIPRVGFAPIAAAYCVFGIIATCAIVYHWRAALWNADAPANAHSGAHAP